MLSAALSQLLERARTRSGFDVEVFDSALTLLYPELETDLARAMVESPTVRRHVTSVLEAGHAGTVTAGTITYDVLPITPGTDSRPSGLMAVARGRVTDAAGAEFWAEFAPAAIEGEFLALDRIGRERDGSRRLLAMLRFCRHVLELEREADLRDALVQAAAVWFDIDARVYERDVSGVFTLRASLPGASLDESAHQLSDAWVPPPGEIRRVAALPEWRQHTSAVTLVPLTSGQDVARVLVLIGALPDDALLELPIIGRLAGARLDLLDARRAEDVRARFEALIRESPASLDLQALEFVRELVAAAPASGGSLTLNRDGRLRRIAGVGAAAPELLTAPTNGEPLFAPEQFACGFRLRGNASAVLEIRPPAGETFTRAATLVFAAAASVLETWLHGAEPALLDEAVSFDLAGGAAMSAFYGRIEEELERARRFDLRLSLVLIDVPAQVLPGEQLDALQEKVRRELRGSDVLGRMNGHRVAALLTHTDAPGSRRAVERVRRCVAETAARMRLGTVRVGHAVFSHSCRTAEALVSQAVKDAEPVVTM